MKKINRILSLALAIIMMMSMFVACGKGASNEDTTDASSETQATDGPATLKINGVDIGEYTVAYNSQNGGEEAFAYLNQKLEADFGVTLEGSTQLGSGYEILLGLDGGDAAVADAFAKNPDGIIGVSGEKIVLLGYNTGALRQTVDCLLAKAEGSGSAKEITVTECEAAEIVTDSLKVMSYNILYDMKKEGRPEDCREQIVETILSESIDVLGAQEVTEEHHKYLTANLKGYSCGIAAAETMSNYIYWKTDKFNLIKKGFYYMSDTPAVKSKYSGSNSYRTFSYVILEVKETGKKFLFVDVHVDYQAEDSVRAKQLAVITSLLPKINKDNLPIIILGDFNTTGNEVSIPSFLKANPNIGMTSKLAEKKGNTGGTLVVSKFVEIQKYVFDYIFVTSDTIRTKYYSVLVNFKGNKAPSDHLPVVAEVVIY